MHAPTGCNPWALEWKLCNSMNKAKLTSGSFNFITFSGLDEGICSQGLWITDVSYSTISLAGWSCDLEWSSQQHCSRVRPQTISKQTVLEWMLHLFSALCHALKFHIARRHAQFQTRRALETLQHLKHDFHLVGCCKLGQVQTVLLHSNLTCYRKGASDAKNVKFHLW